MVPRLIVPLIELSGAVRLSEEDGRHVFQSLRMREGEKLILCDGHGSEALCSLTANREAVVLETFASSGELAVPVHLFPSVSKGDRFEWLLQKSAELGAVSVTPVISQRCVAGFPSADKMERYRRILRSAAEQSGRGIIPELRNAFYFNDLLSLSCDSRLFCYEEEKTVTLKSALSGTTAEIAVLTGPEGGYEPKEAEDAVQNGWLPVSLGTSILRCETAPLMVLSAVRYHLME